MSVYGLCPFCGTVKHSHNGTGSDVACCGEIGHATVIHTDFNFGWTAVTDNYDGGMVDYDTPSRDPIGLGMSEQAALADLCEQLAEAA